MVDRSIPDVASYLNAAYRGFAKIREEKVDAIFNEFGSVDAFIHRMLNGPESGVGTTKGLGGITEQDLGGLERAEDLDKTEVEEELATLRSRLAQAPKLQEGLQPQTTRTSARPRSAAFEIGVKRLYGFRCAVCGSGLRTPDQKPEVQSAHIYPKRLDGSDDVRNGICLCRRHHWAMDAGWFSIADDHTILVHEDLPDHDDYRFIAEYEGQKVRAPSVSESAPGIVYLREHRSLMGFE